MEEPISGFGHEAEYPDPRSGVIEWGFSLLAAFNSSNDFPDFNILHDKGDTSQQGETQTLKQAFDDLTKQVEVDPRLSYIASDYIETQQANQQLSGERPSEPKLRTTQKSTNPFKEVPHTEFCGVYSPDKTPPIKHTRDLEFRYHCPRCDKRFKARGTVHDHFKSCITKHGNPDALKWTDHVSLQPTQQGRLVDKARGEDFRETLKALSGVTIPSRLSPGQELVKFVSSRKDGTLLCAISGGGPFVFNAHVKSHFVTCVKKHGNPTGANWYDRLGPKRIENLLRRKPDVIATTSTTITPNNAVAVLQEDQLSRRIAYPYVSFRTVTSIPQGYESPSSEEYPPTSSSCNASGTSHAYQPPPSAVYPPIPFGFAPARPQQRLSYQRGGYYQ